MEIQISNETKQFIQSRSTTVSVGSSKPKYSYMPYWIEWLDNGSIKLHELGKELPKELVDILTTKRDGSDLGLSTS